MDIIKEKIFRWRAIFSCAHYHHLILGTLFLGRLSGFLVTGLQFQSDVLNLLPSNAPTTGAFVKFLKEFGSGGLPLHCPGKQERRGESGCKNRRHFENDTNLEEVFRVDLFFAAETAEIAEIAEIAEKRD